MDIEKISLVNEPEIEPNPPPDNFPFWQKIILALLASGSLLTTLISAAVDVYGPRWIGSGEFTELELVELREVFTSVIEELINLRAFTRADRVLLLHAVHNDEISEAFVTVRFENAELAIGTRIGTWQFLQVDDAYTEMLQQLRTSPSKAIVLVTENLPEDSILRATYEAAGIHHSIVALVEREDNETTYINLAFRSSDMSQIGNFIVQAKGSASELNRLIPNSEGVI